MTSSRKYRVEVARSGNWWAITVPELNGVFSQARRLDQVQARAREAIALMLDVEEAEVGELDICVTPPESAVDLLSELQASEATAAAASERVAMLRQQLVRQLQEDGFPLRDIGRLIGVSHQRVSQILAPLRRSG